MIIAVSGGQTPGPTGPHGANLINPNRKSPREQRRAAIARLELLLAVNGCPEPGVEARRLLRIWGAAL